MCVIFANLKLRFNQIVALIDGVQNEIFVFFLHLHVQEITSEEEVSACVRPPLQRYKMRCKTNYVIEKPAQRFNLQYARRLLVLREVWSDENTIEYKEEHISKTK